MRIFNELKGTQYEELIKSYEKYLPDYFDKLGKAYKKYPEAADNEEYNLYVYYNKWPIRKLEYSFVIDKVQKSIFDGAKVLEAGCGVSSMPFLWAKFGGDVTAVDFDKKSIELMNKFNRDSYFGKKCHIKTDVCDIMKLPYEDNSFDVVVSTSVLEHLPYPNYLLAINELYRVLKKDGYLVCTCDLKAAPESKRRAVGAFSVSDIKKILSTFDGELIEEDLSVDNLAITDKEIEEFWLGHHYDGIGYDGNREYVAVGFWIKKSGTKDKKKELLQYDELIQELMNYEAFVMEKHNSSKKVHEYVRGLEKEKEELLRNLSAVSEESSERLGLLNKVSQENEKRLAEVKRATKESEECRKELKTVKEQKTQLETELKKVTIESEQLLIELEKATTESEQRLTELKKVTEESEKRLTDLKRLEKEKKQLEQDVKKVTEESKQRLTELEKATTESEQRLSELKKVTEESEKRLSDVKRLEKEKKQLEQDVKKVTEESKQRLTELEKVMGESEQRLEAIEYLKTLIESKENTENELPNEE